MQQNNTPLPSLSAEMQDTEGRRIYSLSFLPLSGTAFDIIGEAEVDGGEAGCSVSMFASRLCHKLAHDQHEDCFQTHLNALECEVFSRVGGVPVREEAPESSPARPSEPPGPRRRPLLLRDENIEVGPSMTLPLEALLAEPLRRRRSSIPTWLLCCWL